MTERLEVVFTEAFYEVRGQVEGSLGSVPPLRSVSEALRAGPDTPMISSGGNTPELSVAPGWLKEVREKAVAQFALKQQDT